MSKRSADKAIQALQRALKAHPAQRVGQVIENALLAADITEDTFYLPDERLAEALDAYVKASR